MCRTNVSHETARKGAQEAAKIKAELGLVDLDPAIVENVVRAQVENVVRAQVQALYRLQELALEDDKVIATRAAGGIGAAGAAVHASLVAVGLWAPTGAEGSLRREVNAAVEAFLEVVEL
jgi:hypothetical protein